MTGVAVRVKSRNRGEPANGSIIAADHQWATTTPIQAGTWTGAAGRFRCRSEASGGPPGTPRRRRGRGMGLGRDRPDGPDEPGDGRSDSQAAARLPLEPPEREGGREERGTTSATAATPSRGIANTVSQAPLGGLLRSTLWSPPAALGRARRSSKDDEQDRGEVGGRVVVGGQYEEQHNERQDAQAHRPSGVGEGDRAGPQPRAPQPGQRGDEPGDGRGLGGNPSDHGPGAAA